MSPSSFNGHAFIIAYFELIAELGDESLHLIYIRTVFHNESESSLVRHSQLLNYRWEEHKQKIILENREIYVVYASGLTSVISIAAHVLPDPH